MKKFFLPSLGFSLIFLIIALNVLVIFPLPTFAIECHEKKVEVVKFTVDGDRILEKCYDAAVHAFIFVVDSEQNSVVTIEIPRLFMDIKNTNCEDRPFIILVDGREIKHEEINEKNSYFDNSSCRWEA